MSPETEKKLARVKRMSIRLRAVCKCLLLLTSLLFVAATAGILVGRGVTIRAFDLLVPAEAQAFPARLALIAIVAASLGVIAKGLYHLIRLFSHYADGAFFTAHVADQIRQLGITAILWAGVHIAWLVASIRFSPAGRTSSHPLHLDALLIGLVTIVVSWFMSAAAEMRDENDLTI